MFVKGQSGNPGGKPKGTKNKAYLSLKFWFEMIAENSQKFTAERKVEIAFQAANMLLPKIQSLPAEPGDSLENARRTQDLLNALENAPRTPTEGEMNVASSNA
jgi:hypothetical protein